MMLDDHHLNSDQVYLFQSVGWAPVEPLDCKSGVFGLWRCELLPCAPEKDIRGKLTGQARRNRLESGLYLNGYGFRVLSFPPITSISRGQM